MPRNLNTCTLSQCTEAKQTYVNLPLNDGFHLLRIILPSVRLPMYRVSKMQDLAIEIECCEGPVRIVQDVQWYYPLCRLESCYLNADFVRRSCFECAVVFNL